MPRPYSRPKPIGPPVVGKAELAHKHRAALEARKKMAERGEVPFFNVRPAKVSDVGYICDAWIYSYKTSPTLAGMNARVFAIEQRSRIRRILSRSKVLCAVHDEDRDRVAGWAVFSPPAAPGRHVVLHYLCVHPSLQNLGVGTALMRLVRSVAADVDAPVYCTHYTNALRNLMARWNLFYNPYLLELPPEDYP